VRRSEAKPWAPAGIVIVVALVATGAGIAASGADEAAPAEQATSTNTVPVERGELSAMVSLDGILTYRARPDGSPYSAINRASGTYTELPAGGAKVDCGDAFYRVDDNPVLLLCGAVPAYRDLDEGDRGRDVRQLNRNLHRLGYDADAGVDIDPDDSDFTWETQEALERLQAHRGLDDTGALDVGDAVFLPESARIAKVSAELGGSASTGAQVAQATSDTLEVQVDLDALQQGEVKEGDRAQITLPGNESAKGRVDRIGRVAQTADGEEVGAATVPAFITLERPKQARGLDRAPVQVDVTTTGVRGALSVPVLALVGEVGGGFAVEVVRDGGQGELVSVDLGLFDTTTGRVAVTGDITEGDEVVVPSS
jgi:peptidoglycan hydrolase-like protein with peptidoglycan-binding domain